LYPAIRTLRFSVSARSIHGSSDRVVARLGLVGVGDRGDADLEVATRLRELLRHRGLLRFGELDVHLGEQHVEIRDGDPDDQVLLRRRERVIGLLDEALRLRQRDDVLHAVQRLRGGDREVAACEDVRRHEPGIAVERRTAFVGVDRSRCAHARQQSRARLRHAFLCRGPVRARRGERGVVALRLAIDLHEVFARCRAGGQREGERGKKAAFHHRVPMS
jgi:hypothetical protein